MIKSTAIIDFMMESVIPALYEDKRSSWFKDVCHMTDRNELTQVPEKINLAVFHGPYSKSGKRIQMSLRGSKLIYPTYDVLSWSSAYEFHTQF